MIRRAATLLEVIIIVAIIATMIGLLLPAIQKVRQQASLTRNFNHLRQIALGLHSYENTRQALPTVPSRPLELITDYSGFIIKLSSQGGIWCDILPHIDDGLAKSLFRMGAERQIIRIYLDPGDPSAIGSDDLTYNVYGKVSYLANWQLFGDMGETRSSVISDGRTQTIRFTTNYGIKCGWPMLVYRHMLSRFPSGDRAVFAEGGPGSGMVALWAARPDWYPMDYPVPTTRNTSRGNRGRTFLIRPTIDDCEYRLPVSS